MKEQFAELAVQLAKFLSDIAKDNPEDDKTRNSNGPIMPMNDELMLVYHVILVQKVLNVSEINCKNEKHEHRVASFQTDFFTNDDKFIILFKDTLFIEMLRRRKLKDVELNSLLSQLFTKPLDMTVLSCLIGNVVMFNERKFKLEFVSESMSEDSRRQLEKIHVLQSQVNEAIEFGAKNMLNKRNFKVPAAFGNKDLTIRGKENDVEPSLFIASVIENLKNILVGFMKVSPTENIIIIDESIGKEVLNLNAGLACTIGNILVSDENSKYMKFADNGVSGNLAKRLYYEVQSVIPNLHDYKFHIKVKTFPKLTFDCDDDENYEMLKDQVIVLGELIGQFLCKEENLILPMNDIILRYHVLLVLKAINVSEIQSLNEDDEHRLASFRHEFFESNEEFVILFKRALFKEILKTRKSDRNNINFFAKEFLTSRQFKVPAVFGNKDITIKMKKSKTERRLDHLQLKISELITKSGTDQIVTLDESLGSGLLKLNGGIAGIVGNLLVSEENTKMMKFTDNWEPLGEVSKRLFMKLQNKTENLQEYRFNVKIKKFPKLSLERNEDNENLAKDFLKKLLFFTNQADEKGVEKILKDEIEDQQCLMVVFLQYHDLIQTWWLLKEASYITKNSKHYEDALAVIVDKPLMSIVSHYYMIKIKKYLDYTLNEKALSCFKFSYSFSNRDQHSATVLVTESSALTIAKMVQSLKNVDYFVFNLEYILDLQANDYKTITIELTKTNEIQLIIIVCNNINKNWMKRLKDIAKLLEKKRKLFVIMESLVETIQTYFEQANNIEIEEKSSLIQMSKKSQNNILENTKVIFQGEELSLGSIIDEQSMGFFEGEMLHKIIKNEPIDLGETNSNPNYEKVKHLYINRRIGRGDFHEGNREIIDVFTLNDITDDVAVITATPGMGKSTLLTHLSQRTKELNPTVWIVRINLLIHSEKFSRWQKSKMTIGDLDTVMFFCEVLTDRQSKNNDFSIELKESNGEVFLKSCEGDQRTVFEIKMFLDYYNRKEIIFLFDGFDEICPTYMDEVLTLLTAVRNYPRKHKMWITSRPYDKLISRLEEKFGKSYELEHFTIREQFNYLESFWQSNIILRNLTKNQCDNLCSFMESSATYFLDDEIIVGDHQKLLHTVCLNFLEHLRKEIKVCPEFIVKTCNSLYSNYDNEHWYYLPDYYHEMSFDTPLHLYLYAEYFQNLIKDESIIPNRWTLSINAYTVYESFIETILKIRFQEKNKIDLCNPDNRNIYENVRIEFLAKHKKLGAYAVVRKYNDESMIFSGEELREIKEILNTIKEGTEKSGFIHSVANGIPNFIHMSFTEYFAVQYICDLLKSETRIDKQYSIWDFVLNKVFPTYENVRGILHYNIKSDLREVVKDHEQIIFDLLLEQGKGVFTRYADEFRKYLYLNIKMSLQRALNEELFEFTSRMFCLIGGITGIVGNLLLSENNTKHTHTDNWKSLGEVSKRLFIKLCRIKKLNEFDVKVKKISKPSIEGGVKYSSDDHANYLLQMLLSFTNQADDTGVAKILKHEMDDHQCVKVDDIRLTAYTIILQYLDLIQRWWLGGWLPLNYHRTHHPYVIKIKEKPSATIFVTNNTAHTTLLLYQSMQQYINTIVVSVEEYVSNLPENKYKDLCKKYDLLIIMIDCDNITSIERSERFTEPFENKRSIFVIEETLLEIIRLYFVQVKKEYNLIQMSEKSHKFLLESAKVMLEDLEMCVDSILKQEIEETEVLNTNPN